MPSGIIQDSYYQGIQEDVEDPISYEDETSAGPTEYSNPAPQAHEPEPGTSSGYGALGSVGGIGQTVGPDLTHQLETNLSDLELQHTELTNRYNTELANYQVEEAQAKANYQQSYKEWQAEPRSYTDSEGHVIPLDPGPAPSPPVPTPPPQPPQELGTLQKQINTVGETLKPKAKGS